MEAKMCFKIYFLLYDKNEGKYSTKILNLG